MDFLSLDIRQLKSIGQKRAEALNRLGIYNIKDLIMFFPRAYEDQSVVVDICDLDNYYGQNVSVIATLSSPVKEARTKGGMIITKASVSDDTGKLNLTFFNNRFIKNMLKPNQKYLFYGKVTGIRFIEMQSPTFSAVATKKDAKILPVYPLTKSVTQKLLRTIIKDALKEIDLSYLEIFDNETKNRFNLLDYDTCVKNLHFPSDAKMLEKARKTIIFHELFIFTLGIYLLKQRKREQNKIKLVPYDASFRNLHNFEPTSAQNRAIKEIYHDLKKDECMSRLLQGDVSSGKTFVAGDIAFNVIKSGYQVALMAPTEILSYQHYNYFKEYMDKLGVSVALLTSKQPVSKKNEIKKGIKEQKYDLVIGTHALIQEDVEFKNLGLVITDEQHRFGVMQRQKLLSKSTGVNMLVMSATPIPRTLALILWGDLDISVLDVLPGGRQKIETYLVDSSYNSRLENFIKKQASEKNKTFIVCPLVDESDKSELMSVTELFKTLKNNLSDLKIDFIHGKLKSDEKEEKMNKFAFGDTDVLVSTTVIEVGIDVKNATLMIIKNAERFGLSQLHQLRGRVGRSDKKSYCVLISDLKSEKAKQRLTFFCKTNDGFKIANEDLRLRGPGDFFGEKQHGLPDLKIANFNLNMAELSLASEFAKEILQNDKTLKNHTAMLDKVLNLFNFKNGEIFN